MVEARRVACNRRSYSKEWSVRVSFVRARMCLYSICVGGIFIVLCLVGYCDYVFLISVCLIYAIVIAIYNIATIATNLIIL